MSLQIKKDLNLTKSYYSDLAPFNDRVFSKYYDDLLNDAGWRQEKKKPSITYYYSELLEDTDWKSNNINLKRSKHVRRDLDTLS